MKLKSAGRQITFLCIAFQALCFEAHAGLPLAVQNTPLAQEADASAGPEVIDLTIPRKITPAAVIAEPAMPVPGIGPSMVTPEMKSAELSQLMKATSGSPLADTSASAASPQSAATSSGATSPEFCDDFLNLTMALDPQAINNAKEDLASEQEFKRWAPVQQYVADKINAIGKEFLSKHGKEIHAVETVAASGGDESILRAALHKELEKKLSDFGKNFESCLGDDLFDTNTGLCTSKSGKTSDAVDIMNFIQPSDFTGMTLDSFVARLVVGACPMTSAAPNDCSLEISPEMLTPYKLTRGADDKIVSGTPVSMPSRPNAIKELASVGCDLSTAPSSAVATQGDVNTAPPTAPATTGGTPPKAPDAGAMVAGDAQ